MSIDGSAFVPGDPVTGVTLRTNFPVRRSARTTNVFCEAGAEDSLADIFAARMGEAASIMATMEQIYTFLFVNMLLPIANIISCPVP